MVSKSRGYINEGGPAPAHIAFVATNSITQGEQVAQLWPLIFQRFNLEISFAHRTFEWGSDARGKAHVHCVIIGLSHRVNVPEIKRFFSYDNIKGEPEETQHKWLSPYLFDAGSLKNRHLTLVSSKQPISDVPKVIIGSKPIDGGNLIMEGKEKQLYLSEEPEGEKYLHPYVGSREYINGGDRWIFALQEASPSDLKQMPLVKQRLANVREFRLNSKSKPTNAIADFPTQFHVTTIPSEPFLVFPKVSSERRPYIPIGWLEPPAIPSDLLQVLQFAEYYHFSIIISSMHMSWMRAVAGRLESR